MGEHECVQTSAGHGWGLFLPLQVSQGGRMLILGRMITMKTYLTGRNPGAVGHQLRNLDPFPTFPASHDSQANLQMRPQSSIRGH